MFVTDLEIWVQGQNKYLFSCSRPSVNLQDDCLVYSSKQLFASWCPLEPFDAKKKPRQMEEWSPLATPSELPARSENQLIILISKLVKIVGEEEYGQEI